MEYMTPNFTKDMVKTHKILIPNMAVTQFRLLQAALECEGYNVEVLGNCGSEVAQLGLKYVHNDTCYPALLVIGQFIDALNSGKYDLDHTALLITQTGGGCRASNYIKLLRKALVKAGYGNIPVASLNFSGLEKGSGLPLTLPLIRKVIACIYYGDLLVALRSQTKPYENKPGSADALTEKWIATIQSWMHKSINYNVHDMKRQFAVICASYASVPVTRVPKVKVGVVGEIYVKYSPLGNNDLEKFLESQDCEVNLPGLMGFVEYCVANMTLDVELYGGSKVKAMATDKLLDWMDSIGGAMNDAMRKSGFYAPGSFRELMEKPKGIISLGAKMGEGWLLTAEMIELVEGGYENIVCAQPFGCLPNHIVGKGMINQIRARYPQANITPVDYDPSATRVNQENRIKLMLANNPGPESAKVARELERIEAQVDQALYYARSTSVERDYAIREVNLADAAREACKRHSRFLIEKGCTPAFDIPDALTVLADEPWLVFILGQVIVNAAKYGATTLAFTVREKEPGTPRGRTVLEVRDNGCGIPAADVPRVFERGFTGQVGRAHGSATGMGLYLVASLCASMGLHVGLASEEGTGTRVILTFPHDRTRKELFGA